MTDTLNPPDAARESAKRRAAERDAEMLGLASPASALPPDGTLPPDAQALRLAGLTPLERLTQHAAGHDVYDGDMSRMAADKAALPYMHRAPAARTELTVDSMTLAYDVGHVMLDKLRAGEVTIDEVRAMPKALRH